MVKPPRVAESIPEVPEISSASTVSRASSLATEARQQKFARDLFEQHGVGRPSGWFSDEDLSLLGDRTASLRRPCRVCHICSSRTWSETYCLFCKHRLCVKCPHEAPESTRKDHTGFSYHPSLAGKVDEAQATQSTSATTHAVQHISRPYSMVRGSQSAQQLTLSKTSHAHHQGGLNSKSSLETFGGKRLAHQHSMPAVTTPSSRRPDSSRGLITQSVRHNPFIIADKATEGLTSKSCIAEQPIAQRSRCSVSSQWYADGSDHEASNTHSECDNPMCRATHDGHYPYRHSIVCALHRSEASGPISITRSPDSQSPKGKSVSPGSTVHRHHRSSFHDHHRIVEHLTSETSHEIHKHYTKPLEELIEERISPTSSSRLVTKLGAQPHQHHRPFTLVEPLTRADSLRVDQRVVSSDRFQHGKHSRPPRDVEHDPETPVPNVYQSEEQSYHAEPPQRILSAKPIDYYNTTCKRDELENSGHVRQSPRTYSVTGQRRRFNHVEPKLIPHDQRHQNDHTMGNHTGRGHNATKRQPSPRIPKGIVDDVTHSKSPIPRGCVLSPPPWLKAPSKEAGDARSRLRPVNAKNLGSSSNFRVTEKRGKSPRGLARRSIRESIEKLGISSNTFLRIAAPSPRTAWHVTQHQRPESWMDDSSEHAHSRTSYKVSTEPMGTSPVSPYEDSPVRNHQRPSRNKCPPAHLQDEDVRYSRNAFLRPLSARSAVLHSRQSIEQPNRTYRFAQAQHENETSHQETRSSNYQISTHAVRDYDQSPSSTLTRFSCSPLQPRRILLDVGQGATSARATPILEAESRESASVLDEASDYEIHRPNPIAPPNHDCGWKDRYLALTAEIRLLKAELSTRASLLGTDVDYTGQGHGQGQEPERLVTDDDDLGIQGVTIIMRLRGRDDLIINTDLTRD